MDRRAGAISQADRNEAPVEWASVARRWRSSISAAVLVCATLGLAGAVPALAQHVSRSGAPAPVVNVTAGKPSEFRFTISPKSVPRGTVVFKLSNAGKHAHGFEIDGVSTKVIRPHGTATITVKFKRAGKYVYQCVTTAPPPDFGPGYNDTPTECGGGILVVK